MEDNRSKAYQAIADHRLYDAIGYCRAMIGMYGSGHTAKLDELEDLYRTLLSYFGRGVQDNRRTETLRYLSENILQIADDISREQLTHDSGALYYGRLRYRMGFSIPSIAETLVSINDAQQRQDRKLYDELVGRVFDILWTATEISGEDIALLNSSSPYIQSVAISAVGMALQERWHTSFARYLASILTRSDASDTMVARATVGLLLGINAWPVRAQLSDREIRLVLDAANELRPIGKFFLIVLERICSALGTEGLTRRMQTEIIANLQNLGPEIQKLRSMSDLNELIENKSNPDWAQKVEESGIEEKLRTFGELQEQGADVMHSTFMNLKGDYFFRDIHNWFLPFDHNHSRIAGIFAESPQLIEVTDALGMQLCDSDLYSLILSIEMMPAAIRTQALSSMGVNIDAVKEQLGELKQSIGNRQSIHRFYVEVKSYIESLYRFYNVYRFKSDFHKIFTSPPLTHLPVLDDYMTKDTAGRIRIADILLQQERYEDAANRLDILTETASESTVFEKLGYAYARAERNEDALQAYKKADILTQGVPSLWVHKQIAACLRRLGRTAEAYETYLKCIELKPQDPNLILLAAGCLPELGQYASAREMYTRYEQQIGQQTPRSMRPSAWCYFLEHLFIEAKQLYDLIIKSDRATPADYLNAGHTALAMGQISEAVSLYRQAAHRSNDGQIFLINAFADDASVLSVAGISSELCQLILDTVNLVAP